MTGGEQASDLPGVHERQLPQPGQFSEEISRYMLLTTEGWMQQRKKKIQMDFKRIYYGIPKCGFLGTC